MKKKKIALVVTALTLALVVAVGATLALFTDKTKNVTNTFTASAGIDITLREPEWDGFTFDDSDEAYQWGTAAKDPQDAADLGITLAQNFAPKRVIPKNPQVKNTSAQDAVWVAVKIDFGIEGGFEALNQFATVNFDTANWEEKAGSNKTVFYYKTSSLEAGATTLTAVFDKVTIKDVSAEDLKNFNIQVTAYAVQAESIDYATAKTELDALIAKN